MANTVIMPKAGMAMEEGTIVKWFKNEGEKVEQGEILLEILTDKVNMEIEALYSGVLLKILKNEGDVVPVTEPIAYIGEAGEKVDTAGADIAAPSIKSSPEKQETPKDAPETLTAALSEEGGRIPATPLAKTLAKEKGIDLKSVRGTGSFGQILAKDVESAGTVSATPLAKRIAQDKGIDLAAVQGSGYLGKVRERDLYPHDAAPEAISAVIGGRRVPMAGMRKVIADKMHASYLAAPHVTLNAKADVTELSLLRGKMNEASGIKISYNDFILRATALAIKNNPFINVSIENSELLYKDDINVGMAVALEEGLIVPVIRNTDTLSVRAISNLARELAERAREGRLMPDEYTGGTFTVTNLGMYGITSFGPIINPPESAILGACAIEEVLKMEGDKIEKRLFMGLSLTFDHRALDGAQGAIFLKGLIGLLENPYILIG